MSLWCNTIFQCYFPLLPFFPFPRLRAPREWVRECVNILFLEIHPFKVLHLKILFKSIGDLEPTFWSIFWCKVVLIVWQNLPCGTKEPSYWTKEPPCWTKEMPKSHAQWHSPHQGYSTNWDNISDDMRNEKEFTNVTLVCKDQCQFEAK